jgi:hypothetical protein
LLLRFALLFFATLAEGGKYKRWATPKYTPKYASLLALFLSPKAFYRLRLLRKRSKKCVAKKQKLALLCFIAFGLRSSKAKKQKHGGASSKNAIKKHATTL